MSERLLDYLIVGTIAMMIISFFRRKKYELKIYEIIVLMLFLAFSGVLGAFTMFYIESGGKWGGQSFFGAVLFSPIFMFPIIKIMKKDYFKMMSLCAPAECIMLAILKVHCGVVGCCLGNGVIENMLGLELQVIESIVAIIVMFILLFIERNNDNIKLIYFYYLLIYGAFRFALNFFRANLSYFIWILSAGHFWSLVAIFIGLISLYFFKKNNGNSVRI